MDDVWLPLWQQLALDCNWRLWNHPLRVCLHWQPLPLHNSPPSLIYPSFQSSSINYLIPAFAACQLYPILRLPRFHCLPWAADAPDLPSPTEVCPTNDILTWQSVESQVTHEYPWCFVDFCGSFFSMVFVYVMTTAENKDAIVHSRVF